MTDKPDDPKNPDDGNGGGDANNPEIPSGMPPGARKRKLKVVVSQSAQEVKFADMFGFTISPTHGLVKFGVLQPETGEFIVHTQIAMTPQGMVSLSNALQANLQKIRNMKGGKGPGMN